MNYKGAGEKKLRENLILTINVDVNNIRMRKKWSVLFKFRKEKIRCNWNKCCNELERISENFIQIIMFYLNIRIFIMNYIWENWGKMLDD